MTRWAVSSQTWTVVPGMGLEVMHEEGHAQEIGWTLDRAMVLGDSGWRIRPYPHPSETRWAVSSHKTVLDRFHADELAYWRARAQHLEQLVTATIGDLENGASARCMGSTDLPEPPVGTRYFRDGHLVWHRTEVGWYCCRPNCPNCPAQWTDVRGYHDLNQAERVLPGEPGP